MLVDLLPSCVYTVAADLCLQPCRKKPLLKTNGITFQWSYCQALESRATFDNFTQSESLGLAACPAGLLKLYFYSIISINTDLKSLLATTQAKKVSFAVKGGFACVRTTNCRICLYIFCFALIADEELLAAPKSILCIRIVK